MPVYIRKGPTEIPEPSEAGGSDDEEDFFLRDPEQFHDQLPQPYRMIDKVLQSLIDKAWDAISEREASRIAKGLMKKTVVLDPTAVIKLQTKPNCLSCSGDGQYVFIGHSCGLSVISTSSFICVATWGDESLEITSLRSCCLGEVAYLLSTVDDMGVLRIFAFCPDFIYLIKSFDETVDIGQRKVYTKFELSEGGDYAAAVIECNGAAWLEVYRFPVDTWLKELEAIQVASQKQVPHTPAGPEMKFSSIGLVMKIRPPRSLSGTSMKSPFEVLQRTEDGNVIGSGEHHMISGRQWESQEAVFKSVYLSVLCENKRNALTAEDRCSQCTFHFLRPGGLTSFLSEKEPPSGIPIAISLWWRGSHNLFQYTLSKSAKDKPNLEPKPDGVWPNANHIICSATSRCTAYICLGLVDGVVTIWDRFRGIPCSVVAISDSSIISRMLFLDPSICPSDPHKSQNPSHPNLCVLVACKSGVCHLIKGERGRPPEVAKIPERTADDGTLPAAVWSAHILQKLVLFMFRNGEIIIQDMSDGADAYRLALPPSHCTAPQWSPVCELDSQGLSLFIRGDQGASEDFPLESEGSDSSLFVFHLLKSLGTGQQRRPLEETSRAEKNSGSVSFKETVNLCLGESHSSIAQPSYLS